METPSRVRVRAPGQALSCAGSPKSTGSSSYLFLRRSALLPARDRASRSPSLCRILQAPVHSLHRRRQARLHPCAAEDELLSAIAPQRASSGSSPFLRQTRPQAPRGLDRHLAPPLRTGNTRATGSGGALARRRGGSERAADPIRGPSRSAVAQPGLRCQGFSQGELRSCSAPRPGRSPSPSLRAVRMRGRAPSLSRVLAGAPLRYCARKKTNLAVFVPGTALSLSWPGGASPSPRLYWRGQGFARSVGA